MTVVELVAAMALLGLLLAIAGGVLDAASAAVRGVQQQTQTVTLQGAGHGILRGMLMRVRSDDSLAVNGGNGQAARFTSRCIDPSGDWVRCTLLIEAAALTDKESIEISHTTASSIRIRVQTLQLTYLSRSDSGSVWQSVWSSGSQAPKAIGAVGLSDTTVYLVGLP